MRVSQKLIQYIVRLKNKRKTAPPPTWQNGFAWFTLFPSTVQADFESIARLNRALFQFDKASIRSPQSENQPR
jgi:hypothetical protein